MKNNRLVYYNTLLQVFTDGRNVWNDFERSRGSITKGRSDIRYKINGKSFSRALVLNARYLVRYKELACPF